MAMRMAPARDTGLSPYQVVFGRQLRTPLDALYHGWRHDACKYMNIAEWPSALADRLEDVRDLVVSKGIMASMQTKKAYDKCSKCKTFTSR